MWKSFYENASMLELPIISMILFMISFGTATWLAMRLGKAADERAALPFNDQQSRSES